MLDPVPTAVPPHDPVNHCHTAPVPRLPPTTVNVLFTSKQVLLLVMAIAVGVTERVLTVTARDLGTLVPQLFDAVTLISPF